MQRICILSEHPDHNNDLQTKHNLIKNIEGKHDFVFDGIENDYRPLQKPLKIIPELFVTLTLSVLPPSMHSYQFC
jgi:hypothetical protein